MRFAVLASTISSLSGLALLGHAALAPLSAQAQAKTSLRVAYVDMQAAILQTEEGKPAKTKIEKEAETKKKELVAQEAELKKLDEEFESQKGVLSEDVKATKMKDFQAKLASLRGAQMNFQQEVRQKEMQETQKIFQNISGIIDDVAKKKGYDFVFERSAGALLYAAKIDDLTGEVVTQYNQRHKVSKK